MTDQSESRAPVTPPARPRIVIEFTGPGAAECTITPDPTVTPAMLYAAAWLIEAGAREARAQQVVGVMMRTLGAPGAGIDRAPWLSRPGT